MFPFTGREHEKERSPREKPKIIPNRTRLNIKKPLDDNLRTMFIYFLLELR
jgi:hypothetical protein